MKKLITIALLLAGHIVPATSNAASCSQTSVSCASSTTTTSTSILSAAQQQLLQSAIRESALEASMQSKANDLYKQTLSNPKVLNAILTIQKQLSASSSQSSELLIKELDELANTLVRKALVKPQNSAKTANTTATLLTPTELQKQLRCSTHTHHFGNTEFNRLITPFLIHYGFKLDSTNATFTHTEELHPSLEPAFDLLIPTKHSKLTCCAIDQNSRFVATCGQEGSVEIRSLATGKKLLTLPNPGTGSITCCSFAPDSSWLAVGTQAGYMIAWSLQSGKIIAAKRCSGATLTIRINPASTTIVTTHYGNVIEQWDIKEDFERNIRCQNSTVLAISPDCTLFAIIGEDNVVRIRTLENGTTVARLRTGRLQRGQFSDDNEIFLGLKHNGSTLALWHIKSQSCRGRLQDEQARVQDFTCAQQAPVLCFAFKNKANGIVDLTNTDHSAKFKSSIPMTHVAITANGERTVFVSEENMIYAVQPTLAKDKYIYASQLRRTEGPITNCLLSPDGNYAIATQVQIGSGEKEATNNLFIHMFEEPALETIKHCNPEVLELIQDLLALTVENLSTQQPLTTGKEKVHLTSYQSALFRLIPDFIKQVLLRTNKILITPATKPATEESKESKKSS